MMGEEIYRVDEKTNIYIEPHPDGINLALTMVIEGKPLVTITYAIDEILMFVHLLLHNLDKLRSG